MYVCSCHSANRPDTIQLRNRHNFCTTESCLFGLNTMTTIAVRLLAHTGWYLARLKHKCLKHTPQTTAEFRNIRSTQYFKHFNELMQFYMRLGLNCLTAKRGDVSILHYWHIVVSHQALYLSTQEVAQCMSRVGFWSMTE